jgi:hypothetical protein
VRIQRPLSLWERVRVRAIGQAVNFLNHMTP